MSEQILRSAITRYGNDRQVLQTVEECAELQQALLHYRQGKVPHAAVVEEIADVLIMAGQMRLIFGERLVDQAMAWKLERLEKRLA